ncbi:MAG: hypothetical protein LLF28_06015 [Nitrospiraceae bacterium]|nr:hypothetical protein [Nitrospiraceae bacterium]
MNKQKTSRLVAEKIKTRIWFDIPADKIDRFYSKKSLCHGYDFYNDLLGKLSWTELFFLLLKGELPSKKQSAVLDLVMTSIINPGPRDWSTQAAMTSGVTKTTVGNALLTGLAVLQGRYNGALHVEKAMEMLSEGLDILKKTNLKNLYKILGKKHPDFPGYGLYYTKQDARAKRLIQLIKKDHSTGKHLILAIKLEPLLAKNKKIRLTLQGVVSAVFLDLGFSPQEGHGIFLIASAPGLLAHLIEQRQKNWNEYPFYDPPEYKNPVKKTLKKDQRVY